MAEFCTIAGQTQKYLDYIIEHKDNVVRAWKEMQQKCADETFVTFDKYRENIDLRVFNHDISKFSADEFTQYRDKFFPVDESLFHKEIYSDAFEKAWEH